MIEYVKYQDNILAIIIRRGHQAEGVEFLTPGDYSQQLAFMHHPTGKKIDAHVHNEVHRSICYTQEVLVIQRGKIRVDFYNQVQQYLESRMLQEGDIILLVSGGHGFEVIEEVEMVEIKQGPYAGEGDKTRFNAVQATDIILQ